MNPTKNVILTDKNLEILISNLQASNFFELWETLDYFHLTIVRTAGCHRVENTFVFCPSLRPLVFEILITELPLLDVNDCWVKLRQRSKTEFIRIMAQTLEQLVMVNGL